MKRKTLLINKKINEMQRVRLIQKSKQTTEALTY